MQESWSKMRSKKAFLLKDLPINYHHNLSFTFHGQVLTFFSTSALMIEKLSEYLPPQWKIDSKPKDSISIYHHPPSQQTTNLFIDDPSSEVFQVDDCFIQRDFAAKYVHDDIYALFSDDIDDGLHNFFRWLLSPLLIRDFKAMLHCSAIIKKDTTADLFLGPSGAGKTTITELATRHGNRILSDDMNLISINESDLTVSAGGVGGLYKPDVPFDCSFKVDRIFWIKQSQKISISKMSPIEQHRVLLASFANLPWRLMDQQDKEATLELAAHLLERKEIQCLHFPKNDLLWKTIDP